MSDRSGSQPSGSTTAAPGRDGSQEPPGATALTEGEQQHAARGTARVASAAAFRQVAGTGLSAVTAVVVARALGASNLGLYASGTAAYYLAGAFTELGFGLVLAREMAKHPGEQGRLLRSTMHVQLMWSAVIAVGLVCLGLITGGVRGEVMLVLAPAVLVGGLSSARQVFTVRYLAGPLIKVDVSTAALQAVILSALALLGADVVALAAGLSAVTCLNALVVAAMAQRVVQAAESTRRERRRILRMAIPLGIASLLSSMYFTIDQVLLGWLVSSRELGEYAAAVKLLSMVVAVPGFVMAAGIPALARHADDRVALSRFAGMLAHWLAVTALPLSIGLMVFAHPAVELVFGPAYSQSIGLLRILMVAATLSLVSNVLGNVLLSTNVIRVMLLYNLASLAVNFAGNIVLAPRFGVTASAWLTAVCELIVITCGAVVLRHRVSYRIVLSRLWRPVLATSLAAAVGLALGAEQAYAITLAIATYVLGTVVLRAWPVELVPNRLRRLPAPDLPL
jgi:O-antigen/teichoic acid export membrane protein